MAITKKFKVSFDVTLKLDSETEELMQENILDLAHRAAAFAVRQGIRNAVKEMFEDTSDKALFKQSPATVREVF